MSMLLWKTLALSGVIGVGSVVVVKAQRSLDTASKTATEEFPLLDVETGLETSFTADDPSAPPKKLAATSDAQPALASNNAVMPDADPFGASASTGIARASAEVSETGDPFAAAASVSNADQTEPASSVTLDEPAKDQFALLDPSAASAPAQSEPNPFDVAPAASSIPETPPQPLKKLSSGNTGPVLMQTPSDDENPFSQFVRSPAAAPAATTDNAVPPQFDAPPVLSSPPLRSREPAADAPLDLPTPTLNPDMSKVPRRRREALEKQSEPDVATQQDAGLAAPQAPRLPNVAPEHAPGRIRVAEAEIEPAKSTVVEEAGPAVDFPPLNLTGGEQQPIGQGTIPASGSSIPNGGSSIPKSTGTVRLDDQPVPQTSLPRPERFNADETPSRLPVTSRGAGVPQNQPSLEVSPFDSSPAVNAPTSPAPAPIATPSDLSGFGVNDRNVSTGPAQPQLTITKEAPSEAVIGQDLEYKILVKNVGRSAAHNVVVEDMIPRGSHCTGTIPKAETQAEKKNLIWRFGTIEPGTEQLIRVRITPTDAGEIGSVATVSFSAEVAARTVIVEPKAGLVVTGLRDAVIGEPNPYRFAVTNTGPIDLKGIFVRTVLPGQGLTHPGGNDLEYEVGDLPRGKSKEVTLALTPSQPGDWQFQSTVTLRGRELTKVTTDVHVVAARLTVVRSGPTKRFVGRPATYSNTVTNNSKQTLSNVTIVETLPTGLDPSGQLGNAHWDAARRALTWTIPQLSAGQAVDLPCTVTPKIAGALQGQVVARDASGNHAELATALEVAGFSSLVIDGGHDGRPVAVGDQVSFRFTVKNRGTAAADQVAATFELPDEVEFISAQGPGNAKYERIGRMIVFDPQSTVPVNGELTYDVVVKATAVTPASGDRRIRVSLNSSQLPSDRPLEQDQQLVIYGDDDEPQPVQRVSGVR